MTLMKRPFEFSFLKLPLAPSRDSPLPRLRLGLQLQGTKEFA